MSAVAALAGRRIDPPDSKTERFPTRNIERVQRALSLEFEKHNVRWLVCSAAAGTDLIGLKTALQLGITCRVVLSPSASEFARTSVEDRGPYWKHEFEKSLAEIAPENLVLVQAQPALGDTFKAINERILNDAVTLSLSSSSRLPVCFAAWDGQPRGDEDFSAHFVERATDLGLPVVNISTL
jgi:hypothetical protein